MKKGELLQRLKNDAAENRFTVDGQHIVFDKSSNLSYQLLESFILKEFLTHNPIGKTRLNIGLLAAVDDIREAYGRPITVRASYRSPEYNMLTLGMSDSKLYTTGDAVALGVPKQYLSEFTNAVKEKFTPGELGFYSWGVHLGWTTDHATWDKTLDTSFTQKIKDFTSFDKMKNILLLGGAAAAAWFFFFKKK